MKTVTGSVRVILVALAATLLFIGVWFLFQERKNNQSAIPSVTSEVSQKGPMIGGTETEPAKSVRENLALSKDHTTFIALSQMVLLTQLLEGGESITVFAPSNMAFGQYTPEAFQSLVTLQNQPMLKELLEYHIVSGVYRSSDLKDGMKLKTIKGGELTVTEKDGAWWINGNTRIEIADIVSKNGVVHSVDAVIASMAQ